MLRGVMLRGLLAMVLAVACAAGPADGVGPGATWRYLPLYAAEAPAGWHEPGFDDAAWAQGAGGFSAGIYGYYRAAVDVSPGQGLFPLRSLLLRTEFHVEDPGAVLALWLRVEFEDGLMAWLNGREVLRRGLPPGPVPGTQAQPESHPVGEAELHDLSAQAPLLVPGRNTLAVQAWDTAQGWGTLFAWPELRANLSRGPLLQNVSSNRAWVTWHSPAGAECAVEWRRSSEADSRRVVSGAGGTAHAVELAGLEPGTRYIYQVRLRLGDREITTDPVEFRTLSVAGPARFMVVGDTGGASAGQWAVAAAMQAEQADMLLHTGDIVYPSMTAGRLDLRYFSFYEPLLRRMPWFTTLGNHDIYSTDAAYLEAFHLPTNSASGTEHYYSWDHGDAHFVSLFVPWFGASALVPNADGGVGNAAMRWLEADLAASTARWKVVFFHQPPRTSGPHAADDYNLDRIPDVAQLSSVLLPVLARHGVQLVFAGHDHDWERFAPTNGVHVVVTGGGGAVLYGAWRRDPGSLRFLSQFHFARVELGEDSARVACVSPDGAILDAFEIHRAPPADPAGGRANWRQLGAVPVGRDNGDGNRLGERFDLEGTPVNAVTGHSANLGALVVDEDLERVRLGLKGMMLWPAQTVALFVGSPAVEGVGVLGDGTAAGGHLLGSLQMGFEGFKPAFVALLGDERADRTDPFFVRPGAVAPLGQGVFRLGSRLEPVAEATVNQFNRSPEADGDPGEQSADYAVVSLPKHLLGVLPGGILHAAAVVVTPESGEGGVTLRLDSGFLGGGWHRSTERSILQPVAFRLAAEPGPAELRARVVPHRDRRQLELSWEAVPGTSYDLEVADQVQGPYASMALQGWPRVAERSEEVVTLPWPEPASPTRWFRVRRLP